MTGDFNEVKGHHDDDDDDDDDDVACMAGTCLHFAMAVVVDHARRDETRVNPTRSTPSEKSQTPKWKISNVDVMHEGGGVHVVVVVITHIHLHINIIIISCTVWQLLASFVSLILSFFVAFFPFHEELVRPACRAALRPKSFLKASHFGKSTFWLVRSRTTPWGACSSFPLAFPLHLA